MKYLTRSTAILLSVVAVACGDTATTDDLDTMATADTAADTTAMAGDRGLIELPADFSPEGIAVSNRTFFVGSLAPPTTGQVLRGDLDTGEFTELVPPGETPALGIKHDPGNELIFVAGGDSGTGKVYDARSGEEISTFEFAGSPSMINDVGLTSDAAYFTDSQLPALYRVERGADGRPGEFSTIDLPAVFGETGDCPDARPIRGNGIAVSDDDRYLILVHMSGGDLYRMDTESGEVQQIELSGGDVCSADGLLLDGNTLYAVQNFMNQIAVVELNADLTSGNVTRRITEPFASNDAIAIPTTIADGGDALYAVTAGFAPPSPDYIVRVEK